MPNPETARLRGCFSFGWVALTCVLATLPVAAQEQHEQLPTAGQGATGQGAAGRSNQGTDSAARMREVLAAIAVAAQTDNLYLGTNLKNRAAATLAALTQAQPDREWAAALLALAQEELRLGEEEEAIEHLLEAEKRSAESSAEKRAEVLLRLGVAYLRLAETRNCVTHHTAEACILPLRGKAVHHDRFGAESAISALERYLAVAPPRSASALLGMWLLNIAHMALGDYPDAVDERHRIPMEAFGGKSPFPRFENVAPALGLDSFNLSGSMIVDDFNGDGHLDVFTSSLDPKFDARLFLNDGQGGFARLKDSGLAGLGGGLNAVHADYDNDGDLDVLVLRGGWFGASGRHPNSLLRNEGNGRFLDVTYAVGLAQPALPTQTAGWADYDLDGDVDLFIGNEHSPQINAPSQLFRNNGDGTFTDVADLAGVAVRAFVKAVTWGDYDNDRDPDLYLSVLKGPNLLFRNRGDGTFEEVASALGVDEPKQSFPAWFWDYDNDGNLDLYVTSYRGDPGGLALVAASHLGFEGPWELARLYHGDGRGGFEDRAQQMGLTRLELPMGSNFGDVDSDGYLDFYLGTGYPDYEAIMPNTFYQNRGGTSFVNVTLSGGFGHLQKGHAVAFADFDNDGDVDVFEQIGGAFPGDRFGDALFRNPGFGNGWIRIRAQGTSSNRAAIGARIRVEVEEAGERRSIYRHVNSGGSFGGNPLEQHLGLGAADHIVLVEIFWPKTGQTDRYGSVAMNRSYVAVEGAPNLRLRGE